MSERHNDGSGKVARTCEVCGKDFQIYKAWLRDGEGGRFCSKECQAKGKRKRTKTMIQAVCKECGKEFSYRKGRGGTGEYCSIPCMSIARGRGMRGSNHPNWKGGMTERLGTWRTAIKHAVNQRGRCEICGSTEQLQGHHRIPLCVNPDLGDDLNNIVVLCVLCHSKEHPELEAWILRRATNGKEES